jgi:cellulose synthase operon protein C
MLGNVRVLMSLAGAAAAWFVLPACLLAPVPPALAQEGVHPVVREERQPIQAPDVAPSVLRLLEAAYLTDEERKDLRIFHGLWRDTDLDTPQRRATAALIRGAYSDESLHDPSVNLEDRAEGILRRGELQETLDALGGASSLRAIRIRAEALEGLGRAADAGKALEPLIAQLRNQTPRHPADLVECVRGLIIRARVLPQDEPAGGDYRRMMQLLAAARDNLGRHYWPAPLLEAELLFAKDNRREAAEAAGQALALNPRSAQAWALLGRMAVEGFNFEPAEAVAERLNRMADLASPYAATILARARLRQNDPQGAELALRPLLERYPQMRPLLALQAAAAALSFNDEEKRRLLDAFDEISPGSPDAYFEVGRTLAEARQYEPASQHLAEAARRAPHRPEPVSELGLLGLQSGQDFQALDALRKAAALDPFNLRVENSLKLVEELVRYSRLESDHFIIRFRPGEDEVLAIDMLERLEEMYRRVTGADDGGIDHEPEVKTTIDIMPNQRWFAVRIAGITRIHTMAAATGPVIAMESPRVGAGHSVGTYDWLRVLRHEFTHTVTLSRTRNRIPHWFTEAAAVYLEDAPRDFNTSKLLAGALEAGQLFDLAQINIAFVRPQRPTDRAQAYAQGHWMYQFMIERWGMRAPLELMDRYAAGEREESAMRAVLGMEQAEFLDQFRTWAAAQVRAWGMRPAEGLPTVGQILLIEAAGSDQARSAIQTRLDSASADAAWAVATGASTPPEPWSVRLPRLTPEIVARWLERHPQHPDLLESAVNQALAAGGGEATMAMAPLLERYAEARPVDPMPHRHLARLYMAADQSDESAVRAAIPHLEFLDAREQHSTVYAVELARRYQRLGELEEAAARAERATIIAPFEARYRELAATIALQRRELPVARRHIAALTRLEPDRPIHRQRLEAVERMLGG